jgi:hypothetical protein
MDPARTLPGCLPPCLGRVALSMQQAFSQHLLSSECRQCMRRVVHAAQRHRSRGRCEASSAWAAAGQPCCWALLDRARLGRAPPAPTRRSRFRGRRTRRARQSPQPSCAACASAATERTSPQVAGGGAGRGALGCAACNEPAFSEFRREHQSGSSMPGQDVCPACH